MCLFDGEDHEPLDFVLPAHRVRVCGELILDTRAWEAREATGARRSLALLRLRRARGGA